MLGVEPHRYTQIQTDTDRFTRQPSGRHRFTLTQETDRGDRRHWQTEAQTVHQRVRKEVNTAGSQYQDWAFLALLSHGRS